MPDSVAVVNVCTGCGFKIATEDDPRTVGEAVLTALITTVFGEGRIAGAVNMPEVEMLPVAVEPPVIPLTFQVTAELDRPATVEVNWAILLKRTWDEPLTDTVGALAAVVAAAALLPVLAVEHPSPAEKKVTPATSALRWKCRSERKEPTCEKIGDIENLEQFRALVESGSHRCKQRWNVMEEILPTALNRGKAF